MRARNIKGTSQMRLYKKEKKSIKKKKKEKTKATKSISSLWFLCHQKGLILIDDAFFQPELGWSVWRSLGRTWIDDGLNWRMLDRLGWGRVAAVLIGRS